MRSLRCTDILLFALTCLVGCSVYRSADRDYFDSNATAGAPKKTVVAEKADCRWVSELSRESLGGLDFQSQDEDLRIDRTSAPEHAIVIIAHKAANTSAAHCEVRYAREYSDQDLATFSRSLVERFLETDR